MPNKGTSRIGTSKLLMLGGVSLLFVLLLEYFGSTVPGIFSAVYWAIAIPFITYLNDKYHDLLHPSVILVVLAFLYSFASVLAYFSNSAMTPHGDPISERSLYIFCSACVIGLLGIVWGTYMAGKRDMRLGIESPAFVKVGQISIFVSMLVGIILGVIFYSHILQYFDFLHPKAYGETALTSRVETMEAGAIAPVLQVLQSIPLVLLLASSVFYFFNGSSLARVLSGILLATNLYTSILSGARGRMFWLLAAIFVYYHYRIKRVRLPVLIAGVFASIFLLNAIGIARRSSNFSDMMDLVSQETTGNRSGLLDLRNSSELVVGMNLMRLIDGIGSGETGYNFGKGFLDDIMCYVPRIIYPSRPLPLSERFLEVFYPGVRDTGGGYGLFFFQDGYWAFGLVGVFLSMGLYSWIVVRIYTRMKCFFLSDYVVLVYAFIYFSLVVSSPRSGLTLSFKDAAINVFPMLLIFFFVSKTFRPVRSQLETVT